MTLDGIVYRTFAEPLDPVRTAALTSLERMGVAPQTDEATREGRAIVGNAGDRTVYADLEKLTSKATRMRVTVKQRFFFRDRATSNEIIAQTEQALADIRAGGSSVSSSIEQVVDHRTLLSTATQNSQPAVLENLAPQTTSAWFGQSGRGQTWR